MTDSNYYKNPLEAKSLHRRLNRAEAPFIFMWEAPTRFADVLRYPEFWPESSVVRVIRASRCQTLGGVHSEFAAALQFAYYYGRNLDALADCLGVDLYEHTLGTFYTVIVLESQLFCCHEYDGSSVINIMNRVGQFFATPGGYPGAFNYKPLVSVPFHTVFQYEPQYRKEIAARRFFKAIPLLNEYEAE